MTGWIRPKWSVATAVLLALTAALASAGCSVRGDGQAHPTGPAGVIQIARRIDSKLLTIQKRGVWIACRVPCSPRQRYERVLASELRIHRLRTEARALRQGLGPPGRELVARLVQAAAYELNAARHNYILSTGGTFRSNSGWSPAFQAQLEDETAHSFLLDVRHRVVALGQ